MAELLERLTDLVHAWGLGVAVAAAGVLLLAALAHAWRRRWNHARLIAGARLVTVLPPPTVDPAGGDALWSNLVGLLRPAWRRMLTGQPHLAFEYTFSPDAATIRIWVPGTVPPGLVERAVQAAWPGAHTQTRPAEPPLPAHRHTIVTGGELRLARPDLVPIRTMFDADPLRPLFGAAGGLTDDETACIQILARPATGHRLRTARRAARRVAAGTSTRTVGRLLDAITPGARTARQPGIAVDHHAAREQSTLTRAVVDNQREPQYETRIRYTTTHHSNDRPGAVDRIRGRAHALGSAFAVYSGHNYYRRHRLRHSARALRQRRFGRRGDLLSVSELASLAHVPTDDIVAGLERAGARAVPPPPGIPTGGDAKPLGTADTNQRRPVGLGVADARHHVHVLGATGSGKSTLLAQMILADAGGGRGAVVIDPKGDLADDVLARLPAHVADKAVVFDPDSGARPPCLNPLDGRDTDTTVDQLVSVFRRVYAAWWGPRTDDILRAACLTLRAQPGAATLADLPRLLSESAYRDRATRNIRDPILRGFWTWYDALSEPGRAQAVAPLMNKLRGLLLRPFVRAAIAGGSSTVDMADVLNGGLCLVRIPKGTLGDDTTRMIGSLILARAWQATTARTRQPPTRRRDAAIYIDECHSFLNLPYPIEDMLAEARGCHVSLVLAHQNLAQLDRDLRDGISANARNKLYFAVSPEDARDLARHTTPHLGEHDLAHLDAFHAAARLVIDGHQAAPFTLITTPLPAAQHRRRRSRTVRAATTTPAAPRTADPRRSS